MCVRKTGWALFFWLIFPALAVNPAGPRFLERHPGNWQFTYLADGRIEMLYGDYVTPREAPGDYSVQAPQKDPVQLAFWFFEAEKEFFAPGVSRDQLRVSRRNS